MQDLYRSGFVSAENPVLFGQYPNILPTCFSHLTLWITKGQIKLMYLGISELHIDRHANFICMDNLLSSINTKNRVINSIQVID